MPLDDEEERKRKERRLKTVVRQKKRAKGKKTRGEWTEREIQKTADSNGNTKTGRVRYRNGMVSFCKNTLTGRDQGS